MLGYIDFAPEASVDDDSTKLLSVDSLLEQTTTSLHYSYKGLNPFYTTFLRMSIHK